jgi:hypothetical protein
LPICACCKKIRDDNDYWQQVDAYPANHSDLTFSHGICPTCFPKHDPDLVDDLENALEESPEKYPSTKTHDSA